LTNSVILPQSGKVQDRIVVHTGVAVPDVCDGVPNAAAASSPAARVSSGNSKVVFESTYSSMRAY
jgi:hypothetical protein